MTPKHTFVIICDWHGRLTWSSNPDLHKRSAEPVWQFFCDNDQEHAKDVISRAVTIQESQFAELTSLDGELIRTWLWPMGPPESAVSMLCLTVPKSLAQVTARERDCLRLLAEGMSSKMVAEKLDIGVSTVHTHLKRLRKKLDLPRVESLISFAARFCHPENS